MSLKELWEIAKTITWGDVIGVLCLFGALWIGLFWVLIFQ